MTSHAISGAPILAGGQWHADHALVIGTDGLIADCVRSDDLPAGLPVERVTGGVLLPGFVDTQVNGGGGVLLNDAPTVDGVATIAAAHRQFGTTALLPTLISDDFVVIERAIAAVDRAIAEGVAGVIGIHIEGPFLNADKRGIHDASKFKPLDRAAVAMLSALRGGKTLVTLAPEQAGEGAIAALVAAGVIVSAGHSLASYDAMAAAAAEGLSGVTHLFNAMTQMEGRAPGVVGAAIDLRLISGMIIDGHHVHPASLRAAFRAKGAGELMLVTDAMPTVGSDADGFVLGGRAIAARDGALRAADGTLAGSTLDMAAAVRHAMAMLHIDLATASRMASGTPAAFLGLSASHGDLLPGMRADIVHLDADHQPLATWIAGVRG
jgi:N-acetylglucosamine-6-phosphate deacetylase